MVLPEVCADAEIRFENRVAGGTIAMRIFATMNGLLERCSDKQAADKTDQTQNPGIAERVIFNPPATIAIWKDGSKTVVKCDEKDEYDPMCGLALCYMKKALGNTSRGLNDALRAGYDELENADKKALDDVRNFLKTNPVRDDFEKAPKFVPGCPVGPCVESTCKSCPYGYLPYETCTELLRQDIIKIRKQAEMEERKND